MKIALLYSSKYGSTEKVTRQITEKLHFSVDVVNLEYHQIETKNYEAFIMGLPVLAENTTIFMRRFLEKNLDDISGRIIGVYMLCWNTEKWGAYIEKLFRNSLPGNCIKACIGGEFNFDKMIEIEKNIVKDITGVKENSSKISKAEIESFVEKLNRKVKGNE